MEPEPNSMSDQVREPTTSSVPVGIIVEFEGMEWSPAHTTIAEGELVKFSVLLFEEEGFLLASLVPASSKSPASLLALPSLQVSFVEDNTTQPISAASSTQANQSFSPPLLPPSSASLLFTPLCCADLPRVLWSTAPPASSTSSCRARHSTSAKQLHLGLSSSWLQRTPSSIQSFVCLHQRLSGLLLCLIPSPLRFRRALGSHLAPPAFVYSLAPPAIIAALFFSFIFSFVLGCHICQFCILLLTPVYD
ncbi:hypothetical protein PO909_009080 [Leuciscus waleckii]